MSVAERERLCPDCRRAMSECRTCLECHGRLYEMGDYVSWIEYACMGGHGWKYHPGYIGAGVRWTRNDDIAVELMVELDQWSLVQTLERERVMA